MRYVWKDGAWRDPDGNAMEVPDRLAMPMIQSDIAGYQSMASGKWIDGRSDQREDLKRTGCRVLEPDEGPKYCRTKKWAKRLGLEWNPDARPKHRQHLPKERIDTV